MRKNRPSLSPTPPLGFTLLEVLLAVAIFSICTTAILTTFRVSGRAFQVGRQATETMQSLRFTVETISRDLRALFYETDYNQRFFEMQHGLADQEIELLERLGEADPDDEVGPDYVGLKVDMRFLGKGGDKGSYLEFAHFTPSDGTFGAAAYGAERVRYFLAGPEKTDLYRQRYPVLRPVRINPNLEDEIAQAEDVREFEKADLADAKRGSEDPLAGIDFRRLEGSGVLPPQYRKELLVNYLVEDEPDYEPPELLAENVVAFDLKFGQFQGHWSEVASWDSDEKVRRTPGFNVLPEDPRFLQKLQAYQKRASDSLPAHVRLKLGIRGPTESKRRKPKTFTIETVIWLPAALEVYTPADDEMFETLFDEDGHIL